MIFLSVISFFSIIIAGNSQFLPGCKVDEIDWIGDDICDHEAGLYNTEECNWDGGDCCPGIFCFDPDFDHLSYRFSLSFDSMSCEENGGIVDHINDGECDSHNFKEECEFDGNDLSLIHI